MTVVREATYYCSLCGIDLDEGHWLDNRCPCEED